MFQEITLAQPKKFKTFARKQGRRKDFQEWVKCAYFEIFFWGGQRPIFAHLCGQSKENCQARM